MERRDYTGEVLTEAQARSMTPEMLLRDYVALSDCGSWDLSDLQYNNANIALKILRDEMLARMTRGGPSPDPKPALG